MKDHRTSITEALHMIHDYTEKSGRNIDKHITDNEQYKNVITYEKLLCDIISYKWIVAFPESYLKCYVTDETYSTLNNAGYTWDMCIINKGNFNELLRLYRCTDGDVYALMREENIEKSEASNRIIERRKQLALLIYQEENIGIWVIKNLSINM